MTADGADRILLPGLTKDAAQALNEASLFVLPSRFEGYPNALLEALAQGLPVLATACPGGTVEILANGVHGMLVPAERCRRHDHGARCHAVCSRSPRCLCLEGAARGRGT